MAKTKNDIQLYSPPGIIDWWDMADWRDNLLSTTIFTVIASIAGLFITAVTLSVKQEDGWPPLATTMMTGFALLIPAIAVLMTLVCGVYRLTHREQFQRRALFLNDEQKLAVKRHNKLAAEEQSITRPIVTVLLRGNLDHDDATALVNEFNGTLDALEKQRKLMKKLSPNPALSNAQSIRQHVVDMNKELLKQIEGTHD